ncbi:spore maturation protein CgeB [Bacillus tianshenii]|uniref:Spore maturation protein CgeB n=1 Tax=Sutcliffiella tianshenii TaxID=1463404 RepID=A0ABS2P629_9BACI|nr:glycosyltransferase [Bacillus tianshenii]MBM7622082.1 spore maturation protein CgeB [Bacillus tianshenii]
MKILLISSGNKGIYKHFDSWIHQDLRKKHDVTFFDFKDGVPTLKVILHKFMPQVALTLIGYQLPLEILDILREHKVKSVAWLTEDPYYMDRTASLGEHYDYLFTIDTAALHYYQQQGYKKSFHLPLGTNEHIYKPNNTFGYISDFCLVGYPYPDRIKFVQLLLHYTKRNIILVGSWKSHMKSFKRNPNLMIHEGWVEPAKVAYYYSTSKIVLNTHRPYNLKYNQNHLGIIGRCINNRTFDVAACGAFQLIEHKEDLSKHFIEGEEIVSFRGFEDLMNKTDYYLDNEEERKAIASRARFRVLKEHTIHNRLKAMLSILLKDIR